MEGQTIWKVHVPPTGKFAELAQIYPDKAKAREPEAKRCPDCRRIQDWHAAAPIVEWEPGSDLIGDFVKCLGPLVTRASVARELAATFTGIEIGPIELHDHPALYRPKKRTRRRQVWLPYEGPDLAVIRPGVEVGLHPTSTVTVESACATCASVTYSAFLGIERVRGDRRIPREPEQGLFFAPDALAGHDFFRVEHTGLDLCTDRFKEHVEARGYTNVEFLEVGNVVGGKAPARGVRSRATARKPRTPSAAARARAGSKQSREPLSRLSSDEVELLRPVEGTQLGTLVVYTKKDRARAKRDPNWKVPGAHGLVIFGCAPNGDAWAVDARAPGRLVVVLSHDLIWEGRVDSPREALCEAAGSLREALDLARAGRLPIDYWEAEERAGEA